MHHLEKREKRIIFQAGMTGQNNPSIYTGEKFLF